MGAFFSARVKNGFETQNGFTRNSFRGMPSLVPRFAFLVVEIGLRTPPQFEHFFRNWHFSQSHLAYVFGLIQGGFRM